MVLLPSATQLVRLCGSERHRFSALCHNTIPNILGKLDALRNRKR